MAANEGFDAALSLVGECVICFEPFTETGDNEPHLLSCGHTFCLKCIRDLVREENGRHSVACPSCRSVSIITNGPPFLPPKNFQLAELIANIRRLSGSQSIPQAQPAAAKEQQQSLGLPPSDSEERRPEVFVPAASALPPVSGMPPMEPAQQALPPVQPVQQAMPPRMQPAQQSMSPMQPMPPAPAAAAAAGDYGFYQPSAPPADVAFGGMYAAPQEPPVAAAAAAAAAADPSHNGKAESEDAPPTLESEKELALTREEQKIFDDYHNSPAMMPTDFSLKYQNGYTQSLFMNVVQDPAIGYPHGEFQFADFKIGGWEVPALVRAWIDGRWYAPKGFSGESRVPPHFSRVLVPHAVFHVSMTAVLTADETYRPPQGGRIQRSHINQQFKTNYSHDYVVCSAMLAEDRNFYDKAWAKGGKWKLNPLLVFSPDRDLALIVPPEQMSDMELMTMKKKVFMEREKKNKGFFGSLISSIVAVFTSDETDVHGQHRAPPTDVYILPSVRCSDLWDEVRTKCKAELESRADSHFLRLQSRPEYSYRNKRVTFVDSSYDANIIYLPVYSGAYQFTDETGQAKWYRVAVNAQSGDVEGERPYITFKGAMKSMFGWLGFK